MTGDFPFMLSPVEAFLGLFSRIKVNPYDAVAAPIEQGLTGVISRAVASPEP
jgi:hypothetical protein